MVNQPCLEGNQLDTNPQFRAGPNDVGMWKDVVDASIILRGAKVKLGSSNESNMSKESGSSDQGAKCR